MLIMKNFRLHNDFLKLDDKKFKGDIYYQLVKKNKIIRLKICKLSKFIYLRY